MIRTASFSNIGSGPRVFIPLTFPSFPTTNWIITLPWIPFFWAQKKGIQGRVIIQFVVGKDGNVSGIKTRGPDPILEKEAVRIISLLPKIKPAEIEGRKVRVPFSTSITFKLY